MNQFQFSRTAKFLLSLPGWWLAFFTIHSGLLISKSPEWLGIYSTLKISFIICSIISCICFFYFIKKLVIQNRLLIVFENLTSKNITIFIVVSIISTIPFLGNGVAVGEDIGGQVRSSLHWIEGKVHSPNFLQEPQSGDLSLNHKNWILRPPGAAILPTIGMLMGFSLGQSIQLGLFLCSIIGGLGWLFLFKQFKLSKSIIFICAISLGLNAGASICFFATANIILFALVPWHLIWSLKISEKFNELDVGVSGYFLIALFLFSLGCFAWIKLSGLIVSGSVGACLFFMLLKNYRSLKKIKFVIKFGLLGILFWIPMLLLEKTNYSFTGVTSDELYEGIVNYENEAQIFGKNWCESTQNMWLGWSLITAPGYSLPMKTIAHGFRDFGIQFKEFTKWIHQNSINEHVLLCGLTGLLFSTLLFLDLKKCWLKLKPNHQILMSCFYTLPFIGLAILAFRYEWNYLLYPMHTFEFWLIYAIPTFLVFSSPRKLHFSTITLMGVILALPISNKIMLSFNTLSLEESEQIALTEKERGLSPSRFSSAIDVIENDSTNHLDILYFLPANNMSDLILRTKMRSLSTHYAGDNFPQIDEFKTTKSLNVYCAYDSSLSNDPIFNNSILSKFPQAHAVNTIFSGDVTVKKLQLFLSPKHGNNF